MSSVILISQPIDYFCWLSREYAIVAISDFT
jgi:hypothetical protein